MAGPSRRAWIASLIIAVAVLVWTEVVMVGGLSLGVFPEAGIDPLFAPLATLVLALAAIWFVAWSFSLVGRLLSNVRRVFTRSSRQQ